MNNVRFMRPSLDRQLEIELAAAYVELEEAEAKVFAIQARQNKLEEKRSNV